MSKNGYIRYLGYYFILDNSQQKKALLRAAVRVGKKAIKISQYGVG